jgi:hypothetical protein
MQVENRRAAGENVPRGGDRKQEAHVVMQLHVRTFVQTERAQLTLANAMADGIAYDLLRVRIVMAGDHVYLVRHPRGEHSRNDDLLRRTDAPRPLVRHQGPSGGGSRSSTSPRAGFSLDEAGLLLSSADAGAPASEPLRLLSQRKLPELDALIERAEAMRRWLTVATGRGCDSFEACMLFDEPAVELRLTHVGASAPEGESCRRVD